MRKPKKKHRERPVVSVSLTPDAIEACDKAAKDWGTNRSTVIERLIRKGLMGQVERGAE